MIFYENKNRLMLNFGHTFAHAIEMAIENEIKKTLLGMERQWL